jgi:hypothetical protein
MGYIYSLLQCICFIQVTKLVKFIKLIDEPKTRAFNFLIFFKKHLYYLNI